MFIIGGTYKFARCLLGFHLGLSYDPEDNFYAGTQGHSVGCTSEV